MSSSSSSSNVLECTEPNVEAVLSKFVNEAEAMFGVHAAAQQIGITGDIGLHSLDGPIVLLELRGRFWHRRETVLANARVYLMRAIPELADVDVFDEDDAADAAEHDWGLDLHTADEEGAAFQVYRPPPLGQARDHFLFPRVGLLHRLPAEGGLFDAHFCCPSRQPASLRRLAAASRRMGGREAVRGPRTGAARGGAVLALPGTSLFRRLPDALPHPTGTGLLPSEGCCYLYKIRGEYQAG